MARSNGPLEAQALMRAGGGAMCADLESGLAVDWTIVQMLMAAAAAG